MKYVIVPQEDINKVEESRVELCKHLDFHSIITNTGPLWYIAHRNYKEATIWNVIKGWFIK